MNASQTPTPIPVLHVITRLIVGGAQENTMFTASLLDKNRYHVEVICGPQTGTEGSLIEEVRQRDVPLTILPELLRQVSPLNDLMATWKLYRLIKKNRYAIVHSHSSKAGIIARLAARLAGAPVIIHTVHGWSFHDHMSPRVRKTYIFLEKLTARFSDALIVVGKPDIQKGLKRASASQNNTTSSAALSLWVSSTRNVWIARLCANPSEYLPMSRCWEMSGVSLTKRTLWIG